MIDLFIVRQSTRNAMIQTWLFQGRCWGLVGWAFPWGTSRQASLVGVLLPLHTRGRCGTSSCLLASEQSDPAIWGVEWAGRWKTFLSLCNSATINENHVSFTDLHLHSGDMVLYSHPPPPPTHTHTSRELDFMERSQDSNRCFLQRDAYVRGGWCVNPQHDDDYFFFFLNQGWYYRQTSSL